MEKGSCLINIIKELEQINLYYQLKHKNFKEKKKYYKTKIFELEEKNRNNEIIIKKLKEENDINKLIIERNKKNFSFIIRKKNSSNDENNSDFDEKVSKNNENEVIELEIHQIFNKIYNTEESIFETSEKLNYCYNQINNKNIFFNKLFLSLLNSTYIEKFYSFKIFLNNNINLIDFFFKLLDDINVSFLQMEFIENILIVFYEEFKNKFQPFILNLIINISNNSNIPISKNKYLNFISKKNYNLFKKFLIDFKDKIFQEYIKMKNKNYINKFNFILKQLN